MQGEEQFKAKYGDAITCMYMDVSDEKQCQQVAAEIASKHGRIDSLVCSQAYFGSKGN